MSPPNPKMIPATQDSVPPAGWILVRSASTGEDFWVDPSTLKEAEPNSTLSQEQVERVRRIALALQEHDDSPIEVWLQNMQRDAVPEIEIRTWEDVIQVYEAEVRDRPDAGSAERRLVYGVLVYASLLPELACRAGNVLSMYPQGKSLKDLDQVVDRFRAVRFPK